MNLVELLQVNADRLPRKSRQAVNYCERRGHESGQPGEPHALANFLDEALNFCVEVGLHYPKVFLLRLGQLKRGQWCPTSAVR